MLTAALASSDEPCPPPKHLAALRQRCAPRRVPCPALCGPGGGADGAECLHSSFWWGASAPLRLWKSSRDPAVPHRPQHVLGAVRAKGAGQWQMTLTFYEPYPPAYLSGSILLRVMVTRNEKLASPGLSSYLYASV